MQGTLHSVMLGWERKRLRECVKEKSKYIWKRYRSSIHHSFALLLWLNIETLKIENLLKFWLKISITLWRNKLLPITTYAVVRLEVAHQFLQGVFKVRITGQSRSRAASHTIIPSLVFFLCFLQKFQIILIHAVLGVDHQLDFKLSPQHWFSLYLLHLYYVLTLDLKTKKHQIMRCLDMLLPDSSINTVGLMFNLYCYFMPMAQKSYAICTYVCKAFWCKHGDLPLRF